MPPPPGQIYILLGRVAHDLGSQQPDRPLLKAEEKLRLPLCIGEISDIGKEEEAATFVHSLKYSPLL